MPPDAAATIARCKLLRPDDHVAARPSSEPAATHTVRAEPCMAFEAGPNGIAPLSHPPRNVGTCRVPASGQTHPESAVVSTRLAVISVTRLIANLTFTQFHLKGGAPALPHSCKMPHDRARLTTR
jgi:hypothetical protein